MPRACRTVATVQKKKSNDGEHVWILLILITGYLLDNKENMSIISWTMLIREINTELF